MKKMLLLSSLISSMLTVSALQNLKADGFPVTNMSQTQDVTVLCQPSGVGLFLPAGTSSACAATDTEMFAGFFDLRMSVADLKNLVTLVLSNLNVGAVAWTDPMTGTVAAPSAWFVSQLTTTSAVFLDVLTTHPGNMTMCVDNNSLGVCTGSSGQTFTIA